MDKYLIDGHKLYWHLDRVLEWQKDRVVAPIYIEVSPVGYCNQRCIFCGIDFAMDRKNQLNTKVFKKRVVEMGKLGVRSIMFAGEGEPLLHKEINLLIKTAKNAGIDVSLTTNGSNSGYSLWKEILPDLTWVRFSVDAGTSEVYSSTHGVHKSQFDKTINSIKDACRAKREYNLETTIGTQFLIIDENISDIENAINLFSEMDIDYLSFKPFSRHPQMTKNRDVVYTDEIMERIQKIVSRYSNNSKMNIMFRKDAMDKYGNGENVFNHCRALPFWGYISSKGDFYTCSVFIGDDRFRVGNIYDDSMEETFYGKKRRNSVNSGEYDLAVDSECRLNCRMARVNEFLEFIDNKTEHINFI